MTHHISVEIKTHPGSGGIGVACIVRLTNEAVIRRPAQLLFPFEISILSSPDVPRPTEVVGK